MKAILVKCKSDNAGVKPNLARILMHGKLGGTGKLIIVPVRPEGFEHGPGAASVINPAAYDPHYHYRDRDRTGLSAYAAPLGMIEAGAETFAGADRDHPEGQQLEQTGPEARAGRSPPASRT